MHTMDSGSSLQNGPVGWLPASLTPRLLTEEQAALTSICRSMSGYHAIQLGSFGDGQLLSACSAPHRIVVGRHQGANLYADWGELPLPCDSVGVALIPHVLEFCNDPHGVLREVYRVLIPEGHVVLIVLNPWSLASLPGLVADSFRKRGRELLGCRRLRDWLNLLGFQILEQHYLMSVWPITIPGRPGRYLPFTLDPPQWALFSAVCLIVARKRILPVTPVRPRWRIRHAVANGRLSQVSGLGRGAR